MSNFGYTIHLVRKDDKAGSIYGCVTTEPSAFGNAVTFWCGLYDGPLNISEKSSAQEAMRRVDEKIVSGGYAVLSFAPFSLRSTHQFAPDVAEELLNGAQLIARSGEDPMAYLRQCMGKRRILDHQVFIQPWRWEDIRFPKPTAPWAF